MSTPLYFIGLDPGGLFKIDQNDLNPLFHHVGITLLRKHLRMMQ